MTVSKGFAHYEQQLRIDTTDLDTCLVHQPELFHHVAAALTAAISVRDGLKLELEEVTAEQDQDIRTKAAQREEKLTEGSIANRLRTLPRLQELTRDFLDAKREADEWAALKESFQQRSFMLRELVALRLGERRDLALEAGAGQARMAMAVDNRDRAAAVRRQRKGG